MKKPHWKDTAELVGIAAIVTSLVFVGFELRQSQQIAIAAQYQERSNSGQEFWYELLDSQTQLEYYAARIEQRDWPQDLMTDFDREWIASHEPVELAIREIWAQLNLFAFDNYHFQYQAGLLSDEAWETIEARIRGTLESNFFVRAKIAEGDTRWRKSFHEYCQRLMSEIGY